MVVSNSAAIIWKFTFILYIDYPIAFEPEGGGTDDALNWSTMGWGYWQYDTVPGVDRQKFLTSGRFMTNICNAICVRMQLEYVSDEIFLQLEPKPLRKSPMHSLLNPETWLPTKSTIH